MLPALMVRNPGQDFELSDEELVLAPARVLNANQRRRRRDLKRKLAKKEREEREARRRMRGEAQLRDCAGYKRDGVTPCGNRAVKGAKHCHHHLNDAERTKLGMVKKDPPLRRPRNQTTMHLMRNMMEVAAEKVMEPYLKALGLQLEGFDENGEPVLSQVGPGLMLHGESKDGEIVMSNYEDITGKIMVAEKLLDRTYGKPRQTQVIEGGVKPIQVQPIRTEDRAQRVAGLLRMTGALPMEGRQLVSAPEEIPAVTSEGRVIPIHRDQRKNGSEGSGSE